MTMGKTYDASALETSIKDKARFILGDTDANEGVMLLDDAEITGLINSDGWNDGLAACATQLANYYARKPKIYKAGSGDVEFDWSERRQHYMTMAVNARAGMYPPPTEVVRPVSTATIASDTATTKRDRHELLGRRHHVPDIDRLG